MAVGSPWTNGFHASVGQVADPSSEAEFPGFVPCVRSKENALDPSRHPDVSLLFVHEFSPPLRRLFVFGHGDKRLFGEDLDAQVFCFFEFAARLFPGDYEVGFG